MKREVYVGNEYGLGFLSDEIKGGKGRGVNVGC